MKKMEKYSARIEEKEERKHQGGRDGQREKGREGDYWQKCPLHSAQEPGGGALGSGGCYNNCTLVVFSPQCALSLSFSLQSHESITVCLKSSSVFPSLPLVFLSPSLYPCALPHGDCEESRREGVCLCELLSTLIGGEMEKNKHQPPPLQTRTLSLSFFSLAFSVSISAVCFLNPAMLVTSGGGCS